MGGYAKDYLYLSIYASIPHLNTHQYIIKNEALSEWFTMHEAL